jgi:H+/gluconate symporter-like permease
MDIRLIIAIALILALPVTLIIISANMRKTEARRYKKMKEHADTYKKTYGWAQHNKK